MSVVEMLVVIGIMGLLVSLLLPAVQSARDAGARTACQNHFRQVGVGLHAYAATHGRLPPAPVKSGVVGDPNDILTWMGLILAYVERDELADAARIACLADPDPTHNPPHTGMAAVVVAYVCPADARLRVPLTDRHGVTAGYTSYVGVRGYGGWPTLWPGVFCRTPGVRLTDVTDGTAFTLVAGERPPPDVLTAG